MRRIVVVGGSLAGVSAVEEIRNREFDGELVLVGQESHLPYDRPPLSKAFLAAGSAGESPDRGELLLRPSAWYEERSVTLRLGVPASELSPTVRKLTLADGSVISYDGLVIATGSSARRLPQVASVPMAYELRTVDDAEQLAAAMSGGGRVVVVGAGFIGMEVAATASMLGLEVTVVDVAATPLARALPPDVGDWFRRRHEEQGVRVIVSTGIDQIAHENGVARIGLSTGQALTAEVVVLGVGAAPSTEWLASSGLAVGDGVLCDEALSTGAPDVVAAGDVARWHHRLFDESVRIEHWTNAVEHGRRAAATLLGEPEPLDLVPYFWTDQFAARARCVGRVSAEDDVQILFQSDEKLVAVFSRGGIVRGGLCVNAARRLAQLREAIEARRRVAELDLCVLASS